MREPELGNIDFRRADHLRWRGVDLNRDVARKGAFEPDHLIPVFKEGCRDEEGLVTPEGIEKAPCVPDLSPGPNGNRHVTVGPWKERSTGWTVLYFRTVYLVKNGNVFTGTERQDNPPVE